MNAKQILIVEDEAIIASDIKYMAESHGYEVAAICDTGEDAIAQAARLKPDLILMDIRLEDADVDGVQAAEELRKQSSTPIVFLTSHTDDVTLDRAKHIGAHGYVVKPVTAGVLHTAIEVALHKAQMDEQLAERERWLSSVMRCVADGLLVADADGSVTRLNPEAEKISGWQEPEALGANVDAVFQLVNANGEDLFAKPLVDVFQQEVSRGDSDDVHLRAKDGALRPIEFSASALRNSAGRFVGLVLAFRDVSARRAAQAERERLIKELQTALDNVKTLRGMLPICSYCKSVRKDDGYWERVEHYVERHSEAQFSHGICPACVREHFPDLAEDVLKKAKDVKWDQTEN